MKLFIYEHCPFCVRARMIVGLKKLDADIEVIMEGDAETPTKMVGRKVVPILQKDDGSYMPESMDIVHYLDATYEPAVITAPAQPAIDDWCERAWPIAAKLAVPRFTRGEFAELATPEARKAYTEREIREFGDLQALIDQTPALLTELQPLLDELDILLDGDARISESDIRLFPLLRSLSIVKDIALGTKTSVYLATMSARSRVDTLEAQAI